MRFLRGLWRFLVGVKDAMALALLLIAFTFLWAVTRDAAPTSIPGGSALVLDLKGTIVDQKAERSPLSQLRGGIETPPEIQVRDVVEGLDRAAADTRIRAVVLSLDNFLGTGAANLQSIGAALRRVKAAGKPVYAYSTAYLDDGYYLAAQANQVWVNPLGGVLLSGPGGAGLYYKGALDKLGVDVNVFRVGTYKSYVEPFTRTEASPQAKAANQALADTLWANWTSDVQAARPAVKVQATLADLPARVRAAGGDLARQSLKDGMVDRIGTEVAFGDTLRKRVGAGRSGTPGSYNSVKLADYLRGTASPRDRSGGGVGVVYVSGEIVDGRAPRGTAGGDTVAALIAKAVAENSLKALVVRIDSPGGSVMASEKIRAAVADAKAALKIPVVASFGDVAASGGYWVSTAADQVFAEPSTITGSIGVFAIIPSFERTIAKIGLSADGVRTTPYSGEPDVLRGLGPDTRALLQLSVEDIYRRFTGLVAESRHLPLARVRQIAEGRVWAGGTARQLGLVTRFGDLNDAIAEAARRAGLDPRTARVVEIESRPYLPFQLLAQLFDRDDAGGGQDAFARLAQGGQRRLLGSLSEALSVAAGPTMQVRCLACAAHLPPRMAPGLSMRDVLGMAAR